MIMALQVSLSSSSSSILSSSSVTSGGGGGGGGGGLWLSLSHQNVQVVPDQFRRSYSRVCGTGMMNSRNLEERKRGEIRLFCSLESSLETAAGPVVGQVTEVNQDTFWPLVNASGDKVVVLDMYTQWCGPCKIMAPKFQQLAEKYLDVVFMKLDCNKDNKALAKELGLKVVPTFKILKDGKVVKQVTGSKFDDLVAVIDAVKSS